MDFRYLEFDISNDRNTNKEVRKQAMKGRRLSGYLGHAGWKNKY